MSVLRIAGRVAGCSALTAVLVLAQTGPTMAGGPAPAPPEPQPAVADLVLAEGGVLCGQVIDPQGAGLAGETVTVSSAAGDPIAAATTDENGRFAIDGLRGGICLLSAGGQYEAFRVWDRSMAPPAAWREALLVVGCRVVRGHLLCGVDLEGALAITGLIGAVIIAATDDDPSPPGTSPPLDGGPDPGRDTSGDGDQPPAS